MSEIQKTDKERERFYLTRLNKATNCLERIDMLSGEVMVLGNPLRKAEAAVDHPSKYTLEVADAICQMIREGSTLRSIAETQGFPSVPVIYRWKELNPNFARNIDAAYADRAYYHIDKASEIAEEAPSLQKDEIPAYKLASDIHLKLAARKNPEKWADNVKVSGEISVAKIVIDTGIRRIADEGFDKEEFDDLEAEFSHVEKRELDTFAGEVESE